MPCTVVRNKALNCCAAVQQSKQQRGTEDDCGELSGSSTHQDECQESSHVCGSFSQVSHL